MGLVFSGHFQTHRVAHFQYMRDAYGSARAFGVGGLNPTTTFTLFELQYVAAEQQNNVLMTLYESNISPV